MYIRKSKLSRFTVFNEKRKKRSKERKSDEDDDDDDEKSSSEYTTSSSITKIYPTHTSTMSIPSKVTIPEDYKHIFSGTHISNT